MDTLRIINVARAALEVLNADCDSIISESEQAGLLEAIKETGGTIYPLPIRP